MDNEMKGIPAYNTDINNVVIDEVIKEALAGLGEEAKKHFVELGYRLARLRNAFNNLQWLYKIDIAYNSMSENHLKVLRKSLRHDLEIGVTHLLVSKVANNIIIFSDDGLGE